MRIDVLAIHDRLAQLTIPLDWFHASEIVNATLGWVSAGYVALVETLGRASEIPIAGPIIFGALSDVVTWLGVVIAVIGGLSVFVLMLTSQLISAALVMLLGGATDVLGMVEHVVRAVGGA